MGRSTSKEQVIANLATHQAYHIGNTTPRQYEYVRIMNLVAMAPLTEEDVWDGSGSGLRYRFSIDLKNGWWLLSMRGGTTFETDTLVLLTNPPLQSNSLDLRGCIRPDSNETYYVFRITASEKQLLASYNHSNRERKFFVEDDIISMQEASEMLMIYFPGGENQRIQIQGNFHSWGFLRQDLAFIMKSQENSDMVLSLLTKEQDIKYDGKNRQTDGEDERNEED
jgi:hypothetical protein